MGRIVDLTDKLRPELVVAHDRAEEIVGAVERGGVTVYQEI